MKPFLIHKAKIVNQGKIIDGSLFIKNGKIEKIFHEEISIPTNDYEVIQADNLYLLPGIIDSHVHFREPGLTYKGDIYSESKAAVAGGVTSYMEMPNTQPYTTNQALLEEKYQIASEKSLANYSFYIGATNNNIDELGKTDPSMVCGIKVFMGSSTNNMLVDNQESLEKIFKNAPLLITIHCEDENTIKQNTRKMKELYSENLDIIYHPLIRTEEACYKSSSLAVELAHKFGTKLHILHISTAKELELFDNSIPLSEKRITAEVCIHHLWFDVFDYPKYGNRIKWNPAIKNVDDKEALFQGILNNQIDSIATDHAPHTLEEKNYSYYKAPSGGPLIQHSLVVMLEFYHQGKITLEQIVEKMCHAPAELFKIDKRGYIKEGYWADLVLVDLNNPWTVNANNILYKCKWSPFEGKSFKSLVKMTFINGNLVFDNGLINKSRKGMRLLFNR